MGFPRTLAELGPAGAGCIDAGIASGAVHRHRIAYGTGARDAAGRAHFYLVCARPERYWLDSLTVAGADEIGTFGGGEEGGPLDACSAPSRDGFRAVKNCLVAYAAGDSRGEYPTDLLALGAAGSGCLTRGRGEVSPTGRYYSRDDAVVAYTAGPGPRRMSFDLRRDQRVARQYMEFLMDETGARYAGLSRFGGASRASEPEDAFVDKWKQREREYFGRQPALVQGCETGRAQDCYEAAHRLYVTQEQAKAKELWTRACGAGHAESCLFDTAVHDAYYARWRARCEAREDFACRVVEGFRGPSIFSQSLTLRRECEIDMPDSCRALREDAAKLQAGEPVLRVASRVPPKVFSRPPR